MNGLTGGDIYHTWDGVGSAILKIVI